MTALHDLAAQYAHIRDLAVDPDADDTLATALEAAAGDLTDKVDSLLTIRAELEGDATTLRVEAARLTARADTIERKAERLRTYVRMCIEGAGLTKVGTKHWTVSFREGSQRVEVSDETALPPDYWRMVQSVNKQAISEALKAGKEVPGAALVRGEKAMVVR